MALGINILNLLCDLHKKNFFSKIHNVIDMGDQDLNISYTDLINNLNYIELKEFHEVLEHSKTFPNRPRLSTALLWKIFGLKIADRLDIIKLNRIKNDPVDNFFKIDLNYPLNKQIEIGKYDLVTDFGNNEHPFNIAESYNSMHNLCKKDGYIIIQQAIYGGNGFYNFDISYFENIAAVNNYTIIYSSLVFFNKENVINTPIDQSYFKMMDLKNLSNIEVIYIFKKNKETKFCYPYQGSGKSINNEQYFDQKFHFENRFPSRTYLPKSYNDLSFKSYLRFLVNKFLRKK